MEENKLDILKKLEFCKISAHERITFWSDKHGIEINVMETCSVKEAKIKLIRFFADITFEMNEQEKNI